ncbi:MAG: MoaD/ThiS family protein [Crenarchaeota archaeon]|nr:MoaD/ThiS family protein [Thermoproteota archaeon]
MTINLKFVGSLRFYSEAKEISLLSEKCTLFELINKLTEKKPSLRRNLIDEQLDKPKASALILVNSKEISVLDGLETLVQEGDEVVFIPVIHGG